MRPLVFAAVAIFGCSPFVGCGPSGTPKVEKVQAPAEDPIAEAKSILTRYAGGAPVTSEAEDFPRLVAKVKEKDAAKGEVLDKGFSDIKAHPGNAQSKAKELLKQL
jgi:hypothetical protein